VYLHFALQGPLDLDALPSGLWAWYSWFWRARRAADPERWRAHDLPLLAALAAAQGELPLSILCRFAGLDDALEDTPAAWRPYLTVRRESPRLYRFYHASLSEFFSGLAAGEGAVEQDFADELAAAYARAHARIADLLVEGKTAADYGLRHLTHHLRAAGRGREVFSLVQRDDWRTRHLIHDPSATTYLESLNGAWNTAVEIDATDVRDGRGPSCLVWELVFAFAVAEVHDASGYVPAELMVRGLESGAWSPREALSAARRTLEDEERATALTDLADLLPGDLRDQALRDALDAIVAMRDTFTFTARLEALAPKLTVHRLQQAVEAVGRIEDPIRCALGLAVLIPHLPDPQPAAETAFAAVEAIRFREPRIMVLAALAPVLPAPWIAEVLEAAPELRESHELGRALEALGPHLSPQQLDSAIAMTDGLADSDWQTSCLSSFMEHASAEQRADILARWHAAAAGGRRPYIAVFDLVRLAAVAPDGAQIIQEALAAAQRLDGPGLRAEALARLAPELPADQRAAVLDTALATIETLDNPDLRHMHLTHVVPAFEGARRLELARIALATSATGGVYRASDLAKLGSFLPREEREAEVEALLLSARGERSTKYRGAILKSLAPLIPGRLIGKALEVAVGGGEAGSGFGRSVAWIIEELPESLRAEFARHALAALEPTARAHDVVTLAAQLADEERLEALDRALQESVPEQRLELLVTALPLLPEPLRKHHLDEALVRIAAEDENADALVALLPYFQGRRRTRLERHIRRINSKIADPGQRARAWRALLATQTLDVLDEAVAAARDIAEPEERARELAKLVESMPAQAGRGGTSRAEIIGDTLVAAHLLDEHIALGLTLQTLAPHLEGPSLATATRLAREFADPVGRARVLGWLAQGLGDERGRELLEEAVTVLESADPEASLLSLAVEQLAPLVPGDAVGRLHRIAMSGELRGTFVKAMAALVDVSGSTRRNR
jgi:hypothetical protein